MKNIQVAEELICSHVGQLRTSKSPRES